MSHTEHIQSRHQYKQHVETANLKRAAGIAFIIIAFMWVLDGIS